MSEDTTAVEADPRPYKDHQPVADACDLLARHLSGLGLMSPPGFRAEGAGFIRGLEWAATLAGDYDIGQDPAGDDLLNKFAARLLSEVDRG